MIWYSILKNLLFLTTSYVCVYPCVANPVAPQNICHRCISYQEKIIQLQQLNTRLLKEVFVYRHVFNLNEQDVMQIGKDLEKEIEKAIA